MLNKILQISPINEEETIVLLSLGSNIGNRTENLNDALRFLEDSQAVTNPIVSSFYETAPFGVENQNDYLNVAVIGTTKFNYNYLLHTCKSIEYMLGRKIRERWDSREIDIDIIFYGNYEVWNKNLTIPHPLMHKRKFVLIPSAEIAGDFVHPGFRKTVKELLNLCEDTSRVLQYSI